MKNPDAKVRDSKAVMRQFAALLKPYRWMFVFAIIFALASTVFSILGPQVLGQATDVLFDGLMARVSGSGGVDFEKIAQILLTLFIIYLTSLILSAVQGLIMAKVSRDLTYNLRKDMHAKLERLPLSYFDQHSTGDVLSLVTNDIDTIDSNLSSSLVQILTSVTTIIGILFMMFSINWQMTLAAMLIIPLSFMLLVTVFKNSQIFFKNQQENMGHMNGHIEEMFGSHVIVKAYNAEEKSLEGFDELNEDLYESAWKSQFFSGLVHPIMNFIGNVGYVLVSIMGGYFASQGIITVGQIQSFIQYMRNFMNPIAQLGSLSTTLQSSLAAAERVFDFLNAPEEVKDTQTDYDLNEIEGHVTFDHVSFSYEEGVPVIHDFSAEVKKGETVAIVGPTGAGKTTMVKLLMRFYDVNHGSIKIDGIDIRDMSRADLRSLMGMVLQDTWLYSDSILENIRYGDLEARDEEVFEAAEKAQVDHFIRTLDDNYETIMSEDITNISQGQKQLLTIARAILADPKILILDEATSSVDTRTEILIQRALEELMKGRTSFIIAHRLSTIRNADHILVMNNGDIVEQGNHEELLALDGFYAELYHSQFADM